MMLYCIVLGCMYCIVLLCVYVDAYCICNMALPVKYRDCDIWCVLLKVMGLVWNMMYVCIVYDVVVYGCVV